MRHYNVVYVEPYSDDSLRKIFGCVMDWMYACQTKFTYSAGVKS